MPSTVTFPLWVCLTPTLSWKHPGTQEGNQSRAAPGEAALVPHFCSCMVPSPALLLPALRGPLPQQGLIKNGESSLQDSLQKPGAHQEPPWAGELGMTSSGPSYDFSSLALNFFAKKGPWTEKSLWGIPSSVMGSSRPSWDEQDPPLLPGWPPWQGWFGSDSSPQSPQIPWK